MGMYVCRSPLLAENFWSSLAHVTQDLKINLTPEITAQLAAKQNCLGVVSDDLKPIQAGWGGSLALIDGGYDKSPIYFHQPDGLGWVHPEYYVAYINVLLKRAHTGVARSR